MYKFVIFIFCVAFNSVCLAGVNLSKTRVVIDSGNKYSNSIRVNNFGGEEVLIQSWIDDGVEKVSSGEILVSPPLRKLGGNKSAVLKIDLTGLLDRVDLLESELVYYLNVKAIPKRGDVSDKLLISTNSRIKVFVRPKHLDSDNVEKSILEGLSVYHIEGSFVITNNSKFSVNFERISIGESEFSGGVILPNGKLTLMHEFASEVELNLINDYGASKQIKLSTNKRKE